MNTPLISVLLPVFNAEEYIQEAIQSILQQSCSDFELIIINDGSTDHSLAIIKTFTDKRIVLIDQPNKGLAAALNTGAAICKGNFIARMDADDISFPDRFQKQLNYLEKHPAISVVSSAVIYIDEKGNECGRSFPVTRPGVIKKAMTNYGCVIIHPGVMMRRIHFEAVGRYSEQLGGRFTDYHLWMKFLNAGYQIANSSEPLLYYRLIPDAISSQYSIGGQDLDLLLRIVAQKNPSEESIQQLYSICKPETNGNNKRLLQLRDIQNQLFQKFRFIGPNLVASIFSGVKNYSYFLFK